MSKNLTSSNKNQTSDGISLPEFISQLYPEYIRMVKGHFKNDDFIGYTTRISGAPALTNSFFILRSLSVRKFQESGFWDKLGVFTYSLLQSVIFIGVSIALLLYLITGTAHSDIGGDGIKLVLEYAVNILFITIYTPWALLHMSRFFWIVRNLFTKDWIEYNKKRTAQYGKVLDFYDVSINRFIKVAVMVIYYLSWFILQISAVVLLYSTLDTLTMYGAFDKLFAI